MESSVARRAQAAALSLGSTLGLAADVADVLQNSNRLTLRLRPGDVVAQVAPEQHQVAQFEVDLARHLADHGCPVAALEPRAGSRVHRRDGFVITLWTYYEPLSSGPPLPADYAAALVRLHAGMQQVDLPAPHFTDRVESAQQLLASRDRTPNLPDADRRLLRDTLRELSRRIVERRPAEQLLHGEPHPGNLLLTRAGPLFIDLETCCRGPVEFDLAHAPDEVSVHYPAVDQELLAECRTLMLAMITTWRWDRDDELPDGRRLATEGLDQLRAPPSR